MAITTTEKRYTVADFTPLTQHQEQTPTTFFGPVPVLHLHCPDSKLRIDQETLRAIPALATLFSTEPNTATENTDVDVWVTSKFIALGSSAKATTVLINYPTISVHGQQGDAVLLVLSLAPEQDTSNDDHESAQFHIVPGPSMTGTESIEHGAENLTNGNSNQLYAAALYKAISDCQELNPSPDMDDDEDYTAPPPFGSGGWITAENMNNFVDEDGNFRMPDQGSHLVNGEPLGHGAGRTRSAADATFDDEEDDESKWQRTD